MLDTPFSVANTLDNPQGDLGVFFKEVQVNLFKNPLFQWIWIFPAKKNMCILPFDQKTWQWKNSWFESFSPNYLFKLHQQKTHHEMNWREFWIAWNIGKVIYQKERFLIIIYLSRAQAKLRENENRLEEIAAQQSKWEHEMLLLR